MLHFTCDLCGQALQDDRFVARVEVYPAFDPEEITEEDLDSDHLQEVADILDEVEVTGQQVPIEDCSTQQFRFDLCAACHRRYVADPLGRDALRRLNFSKN